MFKIQRPGINRDTLLESMLIECEEGTGGGGVFAWATAAGARALLGDPIFDDFLARSTFNLTVGLDSITTTRAIETIYHYSKKNENLEATAFVNPEASRSLFHPKMSWFDHKDHLTLIIGSGNLTIGGLATNWEAYSIQRLTGQAAAGARAELVRLDELLRPHKNGLTSTIVRELAEQNENQRLLPRKTSPPTPQTPDGQNVDSVLVSVLTKSADRWGQSNFPKNILEKFFDVNIDSHSRVLLARVDEQGVTHDAVSRPAVSVKSKNYRLELDVPNVPYPAEGRPVGIFVRLENGLYLYSILMPGDPGQAEAYDWLYSGHTGIKLPRKIVSLHEAKINISSASIWQTSIPLTAVD